MNRLTLIILTGLSLAVFLSTPSHATDYYVDATGGNDSNSGISHSEAWQTISRVNSADFSPGDTIKFKRGEVWREELIVPTSGAYGNPITFSSYGAGDNPIIRQSEIIDGGKYSWSLVDPKYRIYEAGPIWDGSTKMGGVTSLLLKITQFWDGSTKLVYSFGLLNYENSEREHMYLSKPAHYEWRDEYFHGYYYSDGYVTYRNTSVTDAAGLNAQGREVGVRETAIRITNRSYIVVDGIDCYGPGGSTVAQKSGTIGPILINESHHITVQNLTVRHGRGVAINIRGNSSNTLIRRCTIVDSMTGVYYSHAGDTHTVSKCKITNIANKAGDMGDRNFVGVNTTNYVTIEENYMSTQGHDWALGDESYKRIDPAVVLSDSSHGIIRWNYIKDPARGGIDIGGSPAKDNQVYGNVIDGWPLHPLHADSEGNFKIYQHAGLKIEALNGRNSNNTKVYNNLFMNARDPEDTRGADHAAIFVSKVGNGTLDNFELKNNIFYNNLSMDYEMILNIGNTSGKQAANNVIYRTSGDPIYSNGNAKTIAAFNSTYDWALQNLASDPKLVHDHEQDNFKLSETSPCIDNGISVEIARDYYGKPVPTGKGVDIGPFEYQGPTPNRFVVPRGLKIRGEMTSQ